MDGCKRLNGEQKGSLSRLVITLFVRGRLSLCPCMVVSSPKALRSRWIEKLHVCGQWYQGLALPIVVYIDGH